MARRSCFIILTLFMAIAQQIQADCVCNEKGKDGCATCSGIVIPKPKHQKRPELDLPPIGDNCWCSKTMIEPASLPKPCSKDKKHSKTCNCQTSSCRCHESSSCGCHTSSSCGCHTSSHTASYLVPQLNYASALKEYSLPADPISISLAKQAVKAVEVPEAKLAYGFVRKPINGMPRIYYSSIKEENLYALASDVITLKKPPKVKVKEEDYPEPEEEPVAEHYAPPSISYRQLGYETEQFENPKFIPLPSPDAPSQTEEKIETDCVWKKGRITRIQQIKNCGPVLC